MFNIQINTKYIHFVQEGSSRVLFQMVQPSWLKSKDLWEKSPSTTNLANVRPTKYTSEVPQWKRKLIEKLKEREDNDTRLSVRF
jgi:hypothetical protein